MPRTNEMSQEPSERVSAHTFTLKYPIGYTFMMLVFEATAEFYRWLSRLRNRAAMARIVQRIESASVTGTLGDCAPVGHGVSELRIHSGPGYRIYFTRTGSTVYLLVGEWRQVPPEPRLKRAIAMVHALQEIQ